jgi:zinc protease
MQPDIDGFSLLALARLRARHVRLLLALFAVLGLGLSSHVSAQPPAPSQPSGTRGGADIDIPFETFTLPNGLRVVVHTDRKAPIVAVNIWYHVGSKDEPAGRSGFAHLFEHLMFNGSENAPGEYFGPFEVVGATDMNGTTWFDRTNYFQNVPTTAIDMALWMESDRMGHFLGAVDQKVLDEQRGVVQNEKRQGENQPYGQADDEIYRKLYPRSHPYHHSTIGSMNDLTAAALDDVKAWFRTWYGPNNAVLVLAGDIDLATAKAKVAKYFGHIPAGPTMPRVSAGPVQAAPSRASMTDKVPQARIYRAWSVAGFADSDLDRLDLLAQVLGGSRSSRLDKRLLFKEKLVDGISARVQPFELASTFYIQADVKAGGDVSAVEKIIDEELARLLKEGPTAGELAQAVTTRRGGFVRGVERIGGFGGKADTLAECAVYVKDPGCFRRTLRSWAEATPANVRATGERWLAKGGHTLVVTPGERTVIPEEPAGTPAPFTLPAPESRFTTTASDVDRTRGVPKTATYPELTFPTFTRSTLRNGTTVILVERRGIPVVQARYVFNGGYATDTPAKQGLASFTMSMLEEGAGTLDALAFADRAEALGAVLDAGASLDGANGTLSALKDQLDPSLALFADMLRRPRFDAHELERVRATWIARIKQEKAEPFGLALRVLPPLLYGAGHPYALPLSGSGNEQSIAGLTREDLLGYQRQWLNPAGATLIVAGDTTLAEIVPLLEKHFGDWKGQGATGTATPVASVARPKASRLYVIDQPGAVQATILAGQVAPSSLDRAALRLDIANNILGGQFTARLNMNLREEKHWAYGAYGVLLDALGQRPWIVFAPVQTDKAADALKELDREIREYVGARPATSDELAKIQAIEIRSLPGAYETTASIAATIADIVRYRRPDDYVFKRKAEIEAMTPAQVAEAAKTFDPAAMTWVVVGDLKQIEGPIRALGLGDVTVIDADAKPAGRD